MPPFEMAVMEMNRKRKNATSHNAAISQYSTRPSTANASSQAKAF